MQEMNNFLDYIVSNENEKEVFSFETQEEAYTFGNSLRVLLKEEGIEDLIDVSISHLRVRVSPLPVHSS